MRSAIEDKPFLDLIILRYTALLLWIILDYSAVTKKSKIPILSSVYEQCERAAVRVGGSRSLHASRTSGLH